MGKLTRQQEKAMFAKNKSGDQAYLELNLPETTNKKSKPPIGRIAPQEKTLDFFSKAGVFAVPLMFSLTGFDDSYLIGKACINSFKDSWEKYKITNNVDDAVISGIKSFVKNYTLDKAGNSISEFLLHKNDTNSEFEAILKGTISMSTVYALISYGKYLKSQQS